MAKAKAKLKVKLKAQRSPRAGLHPHQGMVPLDTATSALSGLGFDRVETVMGSTYLDNSTVIIIPTRGEINWRVVQAWQGLVAPMNQKRAVFFAAGHEVGQAYNSVLAQVLADPNLSQWKYVLTLEDDNLPCPDAHIRLLESIEWGKYDAVSGIYFTKGDLNMPMAYGDPEEFARTGVLDFRPRDVREALTKGTIMEVNGIACGCSLYRMELFRQIAAPWFVTAADWVEGVGTKVFTQDLAFCERAKKAGKRLAVDLRVKVGHLDVLSGTVF
jgi:hypothetical protein